MLKNCLSKWVEAGKEKVREIRYKPMKAGEYVLERLKATMASGEEEKEKEKGES
jgi:hypothetical protein